MPWLASRSAVPAEVDSFMGPDDAGLPGYRARPSADVKVHPVLPPPLSLAAYSVAVPRTAALTTAPSPVVLTSALPVTRAVVSMRVPAPTVSTSSVTGPGPVPVVQPVASASTPSAPHPAISDADDSWDLNVGGANGSSARITVRANGLGALVSAVAP